MDAPAQYREGGRIKPASRRELSVRANVKRASEGDVKSAEALLKLRAHAERVGDAGVRIIRVTDWLPDYPNQTGGQKTLETETNSDAEALGWWTPASADPNTDRGSS
jgi:hypothetical protein